MSETEGRIIAELVERLIAHGPERMGGVFAGLFRSEEHTSELQSHYSISYARGCDSN